LKILNKIKELKPDKLVLVYEDQDDQTIIISERTPQQIRGLIQAEAWIQARLFQGEAVLYSERREQEEGDQKQDFERFLELMLRSQESISSSFVRILEANNKNMENLLSSNQRSLTQADERIARLEERLSDSLDIQAAAALPPEEKPTEGNLSELISLVPLVKDFFSKKE